MGIYVDENNITELLKQIDLLKTEVIKADNIETERVRNEVIENQVNGIKKFYKHINSSWDFDTERMYKNLFENMRRYGRLIE